MLLSLWLYCHDNVLWPFSLGCIVLSGRAEQRIWGNPTAGSKEMISLICVQLCLRVPVESCAF